MQNEWNRKEANPADPWSYNAFSPTSVPAPKPTATPSRPQKEIPAQKELFTVQKDLVKALDELAEIERVDPKLESQKLRRQLQNAYKILNRYLREHAR